MLRTAELDYDLPPELIATRPADRRDEARLLVMSRSDPDRLEHRLVGDLPEFIEPGDLMVMNDTRVIPARLIGYRVDTHGRVEGLFLADRTKQSQPIRWELMLKSNRKLRVGLELEFLPPSDRPSETRRRLRVCIAERLETTWLVEPLVDSSDSFTALEQVGYTPLPPYILRARRDRQEEGMKDQHDRERYQTVYAGGESGAVAAPTAGLHFTEELLAACEARGAHRAMLTLHVGVGTFKPIECESLDEHPMHEEFFTVPIETIGALCAARSTDTPDSTSPRVLAVGTTTVRALESLPTDLYSTPTEGLSQHTDLLIAPGFEFRHVDAMLTNFHLPRSTLLALVGAFLGEGTEGIDRLKAAYAEAIAHEYRFSSYGDAMLILP